MYYSSSTYIQSFKLLYAVTVQPCLCRTWSETQIVGFLMHRLKLYTFHSTGTTKILLNRTLHNNTNSQKWYQKQGIVLEKTYAGVLLHVLEVCII